ncbi:hypothetical protein ACIGO8_17580 [Streptomyces sp. NPDC053493]|uniref:hypothetical protein n=1 Tax=Streptomyces sp. NPDC053493 TaxID=3365705 RepID=UPI0037D40F76
MSVEQNSGIRKAVRRFAVALVACLAVAGGAALATSPDPAPAGQQRAGATDDWPHPVGTPAPVVN